MICTMLSCDVKYVWFVAYELKLHHYSVIINPCCTNMTSCLQFLVKAPSGWSPSGIGRRCWQQPGPAAPFSCSGETSAPQLASSRSSWWHRASAKPDLTVSLFLFRLQDSTSFTERDSFQCKNGLWDYLFPLYSTLPPSLCNLFLQFCFGKHFIWCFSATRRTFIW